MAENGRSDFIGNLPKIYGMYTGGFIGSIFLMAVQEQPGVGADMIGILFVAFTIVIYAGIDRMSRTMQVDAYYVAGREVPPVFNGMATAADRMSGASFVAPAGALFDRLTRHVHIPEMNGEGFRLKQGRRGTTRRRDRTSASQPRLQSLFRPVPDFCSGRLVESCSGVDT